MSTDDNKRQTKRISVELSSETSRQLDSLKGEADWSRAKAVENAIIFQNLIASQATAGAKLIIRRDNEDVEILTPWFDLADKDSAEIVFETRSDKETAKRLTEILQTALSEVRADTGLIGHNNPPGDSTSRDLLEKLASLEKELQSIRVALEISNNSEAKKHAVVLSKHLNTFLDNFMPIAGKGTAILFVATGATLLAKLGVSELGIQSLLSKALGGAAK